jgi:hypothetical protein
MFVVHETDAAEVRLRRIASGVCDTLEDLVRALRAHEPAFTEESFRNATKLKQGTHNAIWAPALVDGLVLRIATVEDPPEEFAQEMRNAAYAAKHGFGLEPLYFANMEIKGAVRGVSCWRRGTCAHEHLAKLPRADRAAFGLRVLATPRAASEWMLPLDAAAMGNYVLLDERVAMIDFDTYYTTIPRTEAQRDAARGFVVVATTLLACATGSGVFGLTQLAGLAGIDVERVIDESPGADGPPGHEALCAALVSAVTERAAAICAAFRDARVVLARIVHAYVCHGVATHRKPTLEAFKTIARIARAKSIAPFERVVRDSKTDAYIGAFARLAVSCAFDTSAAFDAELALFVGDYAALTSAKRKREP